MDSECPRLLFANDGRRYLATRSHWENAPTGTVNKPERVGVRFLDEPGSSTHPGVASHAGYGGPGSFIVDMQGIDAFLFARAKYFHDEAARQAAVALGLVHQDTFYLRIGAAGAPPTATHPGG